MRIAQAVAWLLALAGIVALVWGSLRPGGWVACSAPDVCDAHAGSGMVALGVLGTVVGGAAGIILTLFRGRSRP